MDTFDFEKWTDDYETYKFNQEQLHFKIGLKYIGGRIKIKTDIASEAKAPLLALIEDIIYQANLFAITSLSPTDIEPADLEAYWNSWSDYYMEHMESFLNILLSHGMDVFMKLIYQAQNMHQLSYNLRHTWPESSDSSDIIWKGSNGYLYDGKSFWCKETEHGTMIRPDGCIPWNDLLSFSKE